MRNSIIMSTDAKACLEIPSGTQHICIVGRMPRSCKNRPFPTGANPSGAPSATAGENVRGAGFCTGGSSLDSHAGRLRLGGRYVAVDFLLCVSIFMSGTWFSERFVWQRTSSLPDRALRAARIPVDGLHGTRAFGRRTNVHFRCVPVECRSGHTSLVFT